VIRNPFSPRAVLLDWDGTVLNSYASDTRAYLAMFRALEIEWSVEQIERHYSPNWYRVYKAARIPQKDWRKADQLWRRAYTKESPAPLPGARGVLRWLRRKYKLGIVTGGSRARVRKQIRYFEFADHFSVCVYSEDTVKKKPHPAPLELALRRLRVGPEECVYVGDAPEDVEMARRAGVHAVGVLGPFPIAERIRAAKPEVLLNSIRELPGYLRSLALKVAPRENRKMAP
jgi:HAD superfamily hydrolase (TIGR01509 family)